MVHAHIGLDISQVNPRCMTVETRSGARRKQLQTVQSLTVGEIAKGFTVSIFV